MPYQIHAIPRIRYHHQIPDTSRTPLRRVSRSSVEAPKPVASRGSLRHGRLPCYPRLGVWPITFGDLVAGPHWLAALARSSA